MIFRTLLTHYHSGIIVYLLWGILVILLGVIMKFILVFCIMLLSYHFSDINSQFMVMSGNIRMERVL